MATCCIALGGNVGNTPAIFENAIKALDSSSCHVHSVSSWRRTPAMGIHAGADFVNAAAVVRTDLMPGEFLNRLQKIESDLGRTRTVHWGPRLLDLDLLLYDELIISTDEIAVPHPALWYRRFVLEPLAQIAPDFTHPILAESVAQLFQRLDRRPLQFGVVGDAVLQNSVTQIEQLLHQRFGTDSVELHHVDDEHRSDDHLFAAIRFMGHRQASTRTQPSHESDRSIRVSADPHECFPILLKTLTDVCSAALG